MMRKAKHPNINPNPQSKTHFIPQCQSKSRHQRTQKTISDLKQSLGSIEKMIEKSQEILRNTRPLHPREISSDSLKLKLKNDSREKSQRKRKLYMNSELDKLSATEVTKSTFNNTAWNVDNYLERTSASSRNRFPQINKQKRNNLFIETDNFEGSEGSRSNLKDNIFISDAISPVSAMTRQREGLEKSFCDSLQIPFNFGRRLRTELNNDSYQGSVLGESLQRYSSIQRQSDYTIGSENPTRKIILRRKQNIPNNALQQYQTEKHQESQRQKRQRIFDLSRSGQKQQGKFSHLLVNPQILRSDVKNKLRQQKRTNPQQVTYRLATQSREASPCVKFNKENQSFSLEQFYRKVKNFGFVERYLSYKQIGFIFEYLQRSSIPQHKWPLYVVDKVYEKMQILSKSKN